MKASRWISPLALATYAIASPSLQQMLGFLTQFNHDFSYPQIIETAQTVNYTGFADDIVGRFDITGTFVGRELNTEYIFGIFSGLATGANVSTPLIGTPLSEESKVTGLVVNDNVVVVTSIRNFNWTVAVVPVRFDFKFMFNDDGLVTQYDGGIFRSGVVFADIWPKLAPHLIAELDLPDNTSVQVALQTRAARDICSQHEKFCLGPDVQYESTAACLDFVLNKISMGEVWAGGQNSAFCRYLHTPMLPFRPSVRCPHIGPTGGPHL
ncbi:hypothetical protein C8J56DRAFT_1159419 [Mycena floridula]|nr:hypothetical protein C8J56DRAFT_1159419 [Mycena floridula]